MSVAYRPDAHVKHIVGALAKHVAHFPSHFAHIFTAVASTVDDWYTLRLMFASLSSVVFTVFAGHVAESNMQVFVLKSYTGFALPYHVFQTL